MATGWVWNSTHDDARMPSRAFLDVDVDDHRAKHARCRAFVEATDLRYGWSSKDVSALGGSEKSRLNEMYESDHEWSARGAIETEPATKTRMVFELFDERAPLACENFKMLCLGTRGTSKESGARMCYEGVRFHRCVRGFMMQGGDFQHQNGAGGESALGKKTFKDDVGGLKLKHDARGVLSMGNTGKNSNTSQFFITFGPCKQLDGKHVVFGKIIEGMEVLDMIEEECAVAPGGMSEEPTKSVVVAECGVLE